ncbi:protein of unknown function UPF0075 [Gloeothece citriformis PCC 7424]|uniref:Anhydro-N-acetylmuramic acid kinase n=1 Tax=Gloeothece citriformis (strain PCC 7424) TaxID=65393 RepID=ANMK_GLOC7|nr:anhydro-N-acetylmuramic acid kinase [Gloeothece citriformis]B7KIQ6.1 RecName: Full=Anhydro-N-acetylmuramic acid kinase; AltName: Full=AnhMurNAc kinase [Gloeothece citriformis PCC 7424]ACK69462.1 protein of unknown function UPF0075 [Gloeothece citriformis PCC 7424]
MYCIGLMSGTSVDGIDAALVNISGKDLDLHIELIAGATYPYPPALREKIIAVSEGVSLSMVELAQLDDAIATQFALAAQKIQKGHPQAELIGSHGQTIYHRPPKIKRGEFSQTDLGYSLQLGRGEVITDLTGIPTVSKFRIADIAAGGQGAPLVPKVDAYLLSHPTQTRCIQNIGGIGNVTYLPPRNQENWESHVYGWDTGPGNVLIDLAVQKLTNGQKTYDENGEWAAQGKPSQDLVTKWLQYDFFYQAPPKSTGRELFGHEYLDKCWTDAIALQLPPEDFLASLVELTVASIIHNYRAFLPQMPQAVLLCGGGSHNLYLKQRLQENLGHQSQVLTTDEVGINGDYKEAITFAVLAYWRKICSFPGNLPQVTGASKPMLLGDIHLPISQI